MREVRVGRADGHRAATGRDIPASRAAKLQIVAAIAQLSGAALRKGGD